MAYDLLIKNGRIITEALPGRVLRNTLYHNGAQA
jgi:hypothetical protein